MNEFIGLADIVDQETEFFPLLSSEDEEIMQAEEVPEELPILPLLDLFSSRASLLLFVSLH